MMRNHEPKVHTDSILIVDDETAGLRLLADILSNAGYEVRPTERPQSVMASVMADPPTLILLDVRMPGMSGFEVCRRLKQEERTRDIPIIFVSALQDVEDRIRSFEAGGVDFISKPFQEAEVLARVSTHLQLYHIKLHLEDLVSERTAALVQANNERKQAERKYRTVADFTYAWESWTNMDGTLEYVSPSCERISGYRVQDFMENPSLFRDIIVMEDRGIWEQHKCDAQKDVTLQEVQFRIKNKGGDIRWLEHACRSVIDEHGTLLGFRASNRDITDRKQSEDALRESRKKAQMLGTRLLSSQETERARLARELHDDIAQRLAFLNIEVDKLEMGKTSLAEPVRERLKRISQGIGELSSDINAIARRLHPTALGVLGLVRSIETECKNFTRLKDIPVTWDLESTLQHLPKEMSLCIYRILQEGMRNILRHARATHVHVTLFKKNERVYFLIKDNGIGFDPASNSQKIGLGIASMEERARLLQGELFIESRPAKGTAVKLALPLKSRNEV